MAVDTLTTPAPVTLPDAKPSDLIESLPENRWIAHICRSASKYRETRYCSLGILMEHAGHDWNNPTQSCWIVEEIYGITRAQQSAIAHINDTQGKDAVVTYLRERGL